jgi:hypothetical protein
MQATGFLQNEDMLVGNHPCRVMTFGDEPTGRNSILEAKNFTKTSVRAKFQCNLRIVNHAPPYTIVPKN